MAKFSDDEDDTDRGAGQGQRAGPSTAHDADMTVEFDGVDHGRGKGNAKGATKKRRRAEGDDDEDELVALDEADLMDVLEAGTAPSCPCCSPAYKQSLALTCTRLLIDCARVAWTAGGGSRMLYSACKLPTTLQRGAS